MSRLVIRYSLIIVGLVCIFLFSFAATHRVSEKKVALFETSVVAKKVMQEENRVLDIKVKEVESTDSTKSDNFLELKELKELKNNSEVEVLIEIPKISQVVDSDKKAKNDKVFIEGFDQPRVIEEASNVTQSTDKDWWLNSGAKLTVSQGSAKTLQGKLNQDDMWRHVYRAYNSSSTENGYYPQNIFRLMTKSKWQNQTQEVYFKILNANLTDTLKRNESNGILLFSRYQDSDNLYYAGLRVDGAAVIKKKISGEYYTLTYKLVVDKVDYDRDKNSNLLPESTWVGIRSKVTNLSNEIVEIKLYIDWTNSGNWELILETTDSVSQGKTIKSPGLAGIRSDFLDLEFDNYKLEETININ